MEIGEAAYQLSLKVRGLLAGYKVRAGTDTIFVTVSRIEDLGLFPSIFQGYPVEATLSAKEE